MLTNALTPVSLSISETTDLGYVQYPMLGAVSLATAAGGSIPAGAGTVVIVSEDGPFRYRTDGTAATPTSGMPVAPGTYLFFNGPVDFLSLAPVGLQATLNINFYG